MEIIKCKNTLKKKYAREIIYEGTIAKEIILGK